MILFLTMTMAQADEASWFLIVSNYKEAKINGAPLKKAPNWELNSFQQLETGDTEAWIYFPDRYYLKVSKHTQLRYSDSTLQLASGKVYIKTENADLVFQVPKFFNFKTSPGDFTVEYDPKAKHTVFEVLAKSQTLQIDSDDRQMTTTEGVRLSFQAEIVDGDIAYDFLLNDRKIPKLKMEKSKIEKPVLLSTALWTTSIKKAVMEKKKIAKKQAVDNSKYICKSPNGVLSSCFFVRDAQQCVRYTCNLSGEWTQKTVFSKNDLCPKSKTVKDCEWIGK